MKSNAFTEKLRRIILGNDGDGLVSKIAIYAFTIIVGFVFVYPLLEMVSKSFMSVKDLVNPLIVWLPSKLDTTNYEKALHVLNFWESVGTTLYVSTLPSLLQMVSCSLVGYGLARFNFAGKGVVIGMVVLTFLLHSLKSYLLPALFGQGMKSAIFILVFFQFFSQIPKSLVEAASLDGANNLTIFFKIAIPTALPAFLLTFLLSMVWYWNDTYFASMYFGTEIKTLPMNLAAFEAQFSKMYPASAGASDPNMMNEGIQMAGTMLNILPLVIIYFFTQRWFMEGIDKTGITGE